MIFSYGILYTLLALIYLTAVLGVLTSVPRRDLAQNFRTNVPPDSNVGTLPGDLPVVKVDYGKYRPNVDDGGGDTGAGEDINKIRRMCLGSGYRIGDEDTWSDCETICNTTNVVYQYYDNANAYVGRLQQRNGAYCVPTDAAKCNLRTSLVIYAYEGWTCLPQVSGLVGPGGNTIALCDGRVWDRGTGTVYEKDIPYDLVFNSFYNDKLSDGDYRFKCVNNARDPNNNKLLDSSLNRMQIIENYCLRSIPSAAYQNVVWNAGVGCPCASASNGQWAKDSDGSCTACVNHVDENTLYTYFSHQPCYSTTDDYGVVRDLLTKNQFLRPCGSTYNDTEEGGRPRCTSAGVQAFAVAAPSAQALLRRFA